MIHLCRESLAEAVRDADDVGSCRGDASPSLTDLICLPAPLMTQTPLHPPSPPILLAKAEVQEERSIFQSSEVTVTKAAVAQSAVLGTEGRGRSAALICHRIPSTLCLLASRDIYSPGGAAVVTRPT